LHEKRLPGSTFRENHNNRSWEPMDGRICTNPQHSHEIVQFLCSSSARSCAPSTNTPICCVPQPPVSQRPSPRRQQAPPPIISIFQGDH
jgi:hypothetical protein